MGEHVALQSSQPHSGAGLAGQVNRWGFHRDMHPLNERYFTGLVELYMVTSTRRIRIARS